MSGIELIRVPLGGDVTMRLATMLRDAVRGVRELDEAPAIYIASHERRARLVSALAQERYPEGTPERVARELLKVFAPAIRLRGETERDFDMFGAVAAALAETGDLRRVSRPLVDQALAAWQRFAQALHPRDRANQTWGQALGRRGELFLSIVRHYAARLSETACHDPEDALWLAGDALPDWNLRPALVVIDDLDRLSPARAAFVRALLQSARSALVVLVGDRDNLPWLAPAHETMQSCVLGLGGKVVHEGAVESRPNRKAAEAWLAGVPAQAANIQLQSPPTRALEVRETARAIKRAVQAGAALSEICVAMPSTSRYRELIEQEFHQAGIPFDAAFEVPLLETAPVAALLDLVRAARAGLDRSALLDALASPLLRFGAKDEAARREFISSLHTATREAWVVGGRNIARDWVRKLEGRPDWNRIAAPLTAVLDALAPLTREALPAVESIEAIQRLAEVSGASAIAEDDCKAATSDAGAAMRKLALHKFHGLLREMRAEFQRTGNPVLRAGDLLRAVTEQAGVRSVRLPEVALDRVRVLGMRELRAVSFKRVFCLGLTDTDLPLADEQTMFLPALREQDLAAAAGANLARELCAPINTAQQADHLFAHLLLSAGVELTLSLPKNEGETPCNPCLQMARLMRCLGVDKFPAWGAGPPVSIGELCACAALSIGSGDGVAPLALSAPPLLAGLRGRCIELARGDQASPPGAHEGLVGNAAALSQRFGPGYLFSPSQLDAYAECPMRFWSRYVVRARRTDEPTLDTPPHAIGTLLHATFERWVLLLRAAAGQPAVLEDPVSREPLRLIALAPDAPSARELGLRVMVEAFNQACADHPTEGPFWDGVKSLVTAGLPGAGPGNGLLARFVEAELERNASGFGIRFVEFRFGGADDEASIETPDAIDTPIQLEVPGGVITLRGSIDRVDEGGQGLEIIDYKTGSTHTAAEVRDGRAFQLIVYLAAMSKLTGQAPQGMHYLRVPLDGAIKPVDVTMINRKPAYDVGELVSTKLPLRLARVLQGMRGGVFMHLPWGSQSTCDWCDYSGSCARRADVIDARQCRMRSNDTPEVPHVYLPDREPA